MAQEIFPPEINWRQVVDDLRDHGCTGYRVAQLLNVQWSTVQNWRDNPDVELRYGLGRALLRLHSQFCGAALTTRRLSEGEVGV